ncbi:MAG: hypothetical protein HY805_01460 [Nitrospirae bacterium]|nr:hypothetical protein [Nitrospirota bacterium]
MTENTGNEGSTISDREHAEICLLYQNATDNLKAFKNSQWRNFGFYSASIVFLISYADRMPDFAKVYISVILFLGTIFAIFILKHYQKKMSTERKVLENIYKRFGLPFRECREPKGDVSKPDDFETYVIGWGGVAYLIVTFIFVMIIF